jgi:hypothetical protein
MPELTPESIPQPQDRRSQDGPAVLPLHWEDHPAEDISGGLPGCLTVSAAKRRISALL